MQRGVDVHKQILLAAPMTILLVACSTAPSDVPAMIMSPVGLLQDVTFKPVRFFDGKKSNGVRFAINLYESSDGVGVSQRVEIYASAAQARVELKRRIKRAIKIIERKTEIDEDG